MIIQELYHYYSRLVASGEEGIPQRFWSREKVAWAFTIDTEGILLSAIPFLQGSGKAERKFIEMNVPEHETRTSKPFSFFLCDKAAYLLGMDDKRGAVLFETAKEHHCQVLGGCNDEGAQAIRAFFDHPNNGDILPSEVKEALSSGGFAVFRLKGDKGYLHERPAIKDAWLRYCTATSDAPSGHCAITGEEKPIARLFPVVSGVVGAQSSGASLVSFNKESFESYGKKQAFNASLSEEVAFGAGAALKYVLGDRSHRCRIGDTTVVFWSDKPAPKENALVLSIIGGESWLDADSDLQEDKHLNKEIKAAFEDMSKGLEPVGFDSATRFFVVGLAPNAARIAVRFFETNSLGAIEKHYGKYLQDTEMVGVRRQSMEMLLRQTASLGKSENIPSTLICSSVRAMLTGGLFPQAIYTSLLSRMRCDHAQNNPWDMGVRAAMMKAYLLRRDRLIYGDTNNNERGLTVALNENNTHPGYLLGRMFAVIEKAQQEAIPGVGATVSDRYIGTAAIAPRKVYPNLIRLAQNHLSKLRKNKQGAYANLDKHLRKIISLMDDENPYPKILDADEQALFFIGYYQQKEDLWTKKNTNPGANDENISEKETAEVL